MQVEFVRAVQFSLLIKAGGRLREFNFLKRRVPGEELFSVDVCNDRGDRIVFTLKNSGGEWDIPQTHLPKWILENKSLIRDAAAEELKKWNGSN